MALTSSDIIMKVFIQLNTNAEHIQFEAPPLHTKRSQIASQGRKIGLNVNLNARS